MDTVTSADGTTIAYERLGDGPPLVFVSGALCHRAVTRQHAEHLGRSFTVINYDRRGRGDSGDTAQFAIEREVEDVAALIEAAGGSAAVYGHSSGAALALHAARDGLPITRLIAHEPPFAPEQTDAEREEQRRANQRLYSLIDSGDRVGALRLHFAGTGMPAEIVDPMCEDVETQRIAHTLRYDYAQIDGWGDDPAARAGEISVPTLLVNGGESPQWMIDVAKRFADAVPDGHHRVVPGHGHVISPDALTPVVEEFLR
ncbi:pimeloyl-ACP methyl ester carboxylesterase [Herbihabitans rhizosphaerae]|uniref:Pimeloyl-ACP methyl ester carboxylesterase n=1 Tax=Herbihabitans rhizosphaerae TaxID=1872711 RepID=A0A4Q7L8Z5_9PSEU|nr:alpha/beta hydrolase [Herbihabitans rhizosphaerae]RZS44882.1 pimeloyl-ACP methyl ester carboxylesterase [Herbihabitans rhizosphaerae]